MTTITANPIAAPSLPQTEFTDTGIPGFARRIARRLVAFYGWLSGPPMTEGSGSSRACSPPKTAAASPIRCSNQPACRPE